MVSVKKLYDELEMEVIRFSAEDVIVTSGEDDCAPPSKAVSENLAAELITDDTSEMVFK